MPKTKPSYPAEFRREAVELLRFSGRPVSQIAKELGVSEQSLRVWRHRADIEAGKAEGLITDNGSAYISTIHAIACRTMGIRHLRTRPRRPQTNGKAERFIRTMLGGWAYGAIYATSTETHPSP